MTDICDSYDSGFAPVPETLEAFIPLWCEKALKKEDTVAQNTKVIRVDTKRITNDDTGSLDGGGMTVAKLVRLCLEYDGEVTGKEPESMVAKVVVTGTLQFNFGLKTRLLVNAMYGKGFEEQMIRRDIKFYREAIPLVPETYCYPKVYYTGITDGGDRGFYEAVIRNKPHRIRTVTLMEDMKGWKSKMHGRHLLTYDEAVACLKNVAILHANFWDERNKEIKAKFDKDFGLSEIKFRMAATSKYVEKARQKFLSNTLSLKKKS